MAEVLKSKATNNLSTLSSEDLHVAGIDVYDCNVLPFLESMTSQIWYGKRFANYKFALQALSGVIPGIDMLQEQLEGTIDSDVLDLGVEVDIDMDCNESDDRASKFHVDVSSYSVLASNHPTLLLIDPDDLNYYGNRPKSEFKDTLVFSGDVNPDHVYSAAPGQLVGFRKRTIHARPQGTFDHRSLLMIDFSPF